MEPHRAHKLFAFITMNWRAKPLISYLAIIQLIASTTTKTGLTVACQLEFLMLTRRASRFSRRFGDGIPERQTTFLSWRSWNYTIAPKATRRMMRLFGLKPLGRFTAGTDNERARESFRHSITLDPAFASPYSGLSLTYIREVLSYGTPQSSECFTWAETWARKAVEIDTNDSEARAILAHARVLAGDREEGRHRAVLALEMNANSAWANYVKGQSLVFDGYPCEAREPLTAALRLDPRGPLTSHFMMLLMISHYFERDYANAIEAGLRMVSRYPELPQPYRYLAASYGQLGRSGEARKALDKAMASNDSFQGYVSSRPIWYRSEDYDHMLEGLRKAGWEG